AEQPAGGLPDSDPALDSRPGPGDVLAGGVPGADRAVLDHVPDGDAQPAEGPERGDVPGFQHLDGQRPADTHVAGRVARHDALRERSARAGPRPPAYGVV